MKPVPILNASGGMNVVASESKLASNEVREAKNVLIHKSGSFERRDGYSLAQAATRAHSVWTGKEQLRTFYAAAGTLYEVLQVQPTFSAAARATGLWDAPARYAERGGRIYVSAGRMLRIDQDGGVRTPGVIDMVGFRPTANGTTAGGLSPGRYGLALSAVNDLGEESGLSEVTWVDLPATQGAIAFDVPPTSADVAAWNVYRTPPNGAELYFAKQVAASSVLTLGELGRREAGWLRSPLPPGGELAAWNGRLWSAQGTFLYYTDPFSDLCSVRDGYLPFGTPCDRLLLPMPAGMYVGTDEGVVFLAGSGPGDFRHTLAAEGAPIRHSGAIVDAALFPDRLVGDGTSQVAVWFSDVGLNIGLPDGRVLTPQAGRILISGVPRATTTPVVQKGVKQLITALESMTIGDGGAADTTP
jgi:hypothetical protein